MSPSPDGAVCAPSTSARGNEESPWSCRGAALVVAGLFLLGSAAAMPAAERLVETRRDELPLLEDTKVPPHTYKEWTTWNRLAVNRLEQFFLAAAGKELEGEIPSP